MNRVHPHEGCAEGAQPSGPLASRPRLPYIGDMRSWVPFSFLVMPLACASLAELDDFADATPEAGGPVASGGGTTSGGGAGGAASASSSSTGGGGGVATGGGGGDAEWMLYTLSGTTDDLANGEWSSQSLGLAWGGGNAPTEGILTASDFHYFDQLVVLTEAGQVHRRDGFIWRPVVAASALFPEVETSGTVLSSYTVPGAWTDIGSPDEDRSTEQIIFSVSNGAASNFYIYDLTDALDSAELSASGVLADGSASCAESCKSCEGPDRPNIREQWSFRRLDEALIGTSADAYRGWGYYDDGNIYQSNAAFCWEQIPIAQHPMFAGKAGAPPLERIRAAYFEEPDTVQMVVAP